MFVRTFCQMVGNTLAVINSAISKTGVGIASAFLLGMVTVVLAQVFFRYILNDSLVWAEELSKSMMVWVAFLVAPMAMRQGANVRIEMLTEALPARLRIFLSLVIGVAVIWVLSIFLYESIGFWERGKQVSAASLPVSMAVFYTIVPVGFTALLMVGLEMVLRDFLSLIDPDKDSDKSEGENRSVIGGGSK